VRRQKKFDDLQLAALEELKRIAFLDVREVAQWNREPTFSSDGELIGIEEQLRVTPSAQLSPAAAASIKGVFAKAGGVRVELHDKQQALINILRITGAFKDDKPPPSPVTVNQLNVGGSTALDATRRIGFMLAALAAAGETLRVPLVEGEPVIVEQDAK
jgi:hypothetical protein